MNKDGQRQDTLFCDAHLIYFEYFIVQPHQKWAEHLDNTETGKRNISKKCSIP